MENNRKSDATYHISTENDKKLVKSYTRSFEKQFVSGVTKLSNSRLYVYYSQKLSQGKFVCANLPSIVNAGQKQRVKFCFFKGLYSLQQAVLTFSIEYGMYRQIYGCFAQVFREFYRFFL